MRSKLFVPGSRPELFDKAMASAADSISFDLDDAVDPARKDEARAYVQTFLARRDRRSDGKTVIVRVNALGSEYFKADIAACASAAVDMVNLVKVDSAADVRAAADAMGAAETAGGITKPVAFLVTIETPQALRSSADIARADQRVVGLQLGFADLLEPLGIDRGNTQAVQQIQLMLRLAAGDAGVWVYDGAFANVRDEDGFVREAEVSRRLGYIGKSCIHPSQIVLANRAFMPPREEIERARKTVAAAQRAATDGIGAFLVDGRMVDAPFVRRAEAIVALAERLGIATDEGA